MKNLGLLTKTAGAALVLAAGLMTGCGSDGGGSSVKKGTFVDAAVSGISFKTATQEGTTDEDGTFTFKKGESVTFYIGSIELPPGIPQGNVITPAHLAGTADWQNDEVAVNIIRFLLTLDADGNSENGIQIPEGAADIADTAIDFGDDFDSEANSFFETLESEITFTFEGIVTADAAKTHFSATIDALGITIEIQVSTDVGSCTNQNTAEIQGNYVGALTGGSLAGDTPVVVEENSVLKVNGDAVGGTCSFADTSVTGAVTVTALTWTWTDGSDVYTILDNGSSLTFTAVIGGDVSTGMLTPP